MGHLAPVDAAAGQDRDAAWEQLPAVDGRHVWHPCVEDGEPGDVDEVRRLSGVTDVHELARFPDPLAPATAARRSGRPPMPAEAVAAAVRALDGPDLVLVEGAGGLLVELDDRGATIADVARLLGAPVLLVARAGLGTLNHTALSCEALRARDLGCPGVVVRAWPADPDLAAQCNLHDLPRLTGRPLLGRVPEGAAQLDPAAFAAQAPTWIPTEGLL